MAEESYPLVSIVVLSYNRPEAVSRTIRELKELEYPNLEIIIVDNNSELPVKNIVRDDKKIKVLELDSNIGVAGRNKGIEKATGKYLITLDDDVFGLSDESIHDLVTLMEEYARLGAVNFRVLDDVTRGQVNWCHHRKVELWGDKIFDTYEISEGAVAFRASALKKSGLYPDYFFISHEGADLAIRLMECGYDVIYYPRVDVLHAHAPEARPGWRRYFYDTRNAIWLALRCYSIPIAARKLPVSLGALLIYSIRDGYTKHWFRGLIAAIKGRRIVLEDRVTISSETWRRINLIEKENPSFIYMVKIRIFQRKVRI